MIAELQMLLPEFSGSASHTCCFLHIVNLVAKLLIHQFDAKKMMVEGDHELADLWRELEDKEVTFQDGVVGADDNKAVEEFDNDEGWVDEMENMTDLEKDKLEKSIWPVND